MTLSPVVLLVRVWLRVDALSLPQNGHQAVCDCGSQEAQRGGPVPQDLQDEALCHQPRVGQEPLLLLHVSVEACQACQRRGLVGARGTSIAGCFVCGCVGGVLRMAACVPDQPLVSQTNCCDRVGSSLPVIVSWAASGRRHPAPSMTRRFAAYNLPLAPVIRPSESYGSRLVSCLSCCLSAVTRYPLTSFFWPCRLTQPSFHKRPGACSSQPWRSYCGPVIPMFSWM
jgi:hypothetical protein